MTYGNFKTYYCCPTEKCSGLICDKDLFQKPNVGKTQFGTCPECKLELELTQLSRTNSMFVIFDLVHQLETLACDPDVVNELDKG